MKIVTADITGSLIVNGVDVTNNVVSSSVFSGSIAGRVTNLEQFSSSLDATFATDASVTASILVLSQSVQVSQAALSSSYAATSGSFVITSGSYAAASASLSTRVTNTEATASTNTQASASFAAYSGSISTRLTTDETNITTLTNASSSFAAQSASLSTRLTTDETNFTNLSSSFASTSGSIAGRVTLIEGQYATTGSNIFTGTQRITQASNAISFTSTASLYTDGGLRVSKDSYVSGTAYFNNVVVYGTSSIQYITSSQVNFGTNIITVNTDTPAVRFGGLAVYDSGSTSLTGSMLWDSEKNNWIYSNPSGSSYNSAMLMNGPRNTGSLGSEQGTTACAMMIGQGGDHITSSMIYSYGNATCFYNNSFISSSGAACFSGTVCANYLYSTTNVVASDTLFTGNSVRKLSNNQCIFFRNAAGDVEMTIGGTGNVGIGYTNPSVQLQVSGTIATGDSTNGWGRLSFNTNEVRLQASKDGIDPIGISFFTQASGGAFAERMRIACDGRIGIGTALPSADLQVNKNCDVVVAISNCIGVTTGNRGALAFYNCATSTVALIRAGAVTDNVGTELQFHTRPAGGSLTQAMTLDSSGKLGIGTILPNASLSINACRTLATVSGQACISSGVNDNGCIFFGLGDANSTVRVGMYGTQCWNGSFTDYITKFTLTKGGVGNIDWLSVNNNGVATFACQVCASGLSMCGNVVLSRASTSAGANVEFRTAGTLNWYLGTRGLTNNNFYIVNEGLSGLSNIIIDATSGTTTFACQISTPAIVSNPTSTFAACITSCATDYSMYIRNMSSGFPLALYTAPDSNSITDDLKVLRIARSSNDNQYLAVSMIYGGFGYGYKFTPRYYNGAAYVCGAPTVIDGYGNVGINCTAPFMPLTVAGCAGIDRLAINCTGFNGFGEHLQVRGCARFFAGQLRISNAGADGNYMFLTHDDVNGYLCICRTVYAGNLIISPYGGVGINTSSPTTKLSINSGINTSSATVMTLQQATNGAVKDAVGFGVSIQNGGEATNAADLYISTATAGALCERMRITSGGNVGINNSSPDSNSRLDVNGQAFVARLAVYNDNGTPSLGTSPTLYSPASATLGISMGTAERIRISTSGTCFSCLISAPAMCQPTGFTVYSFLINYGASYTDISSGNYLSIGGTEPGTMNSYCAYAHGGISPRAVASNTEGMSWTCLRFVLRVGSPVGDQSTTPTYLQTAGYFYTVGFYGICTCTNIVSAMDGSRGYSTVVLPWIPFSAFTGAGDVTGFGIRNVGPTTTRIGSVWIQYK